MTCMAGTKQTRDHRAGCRKPDVIRYPAPFCGYLLASNRYPPMGAGLQVPVGFQQVPTNGCRVRVRVSGFEVKKQAGTRQIPTLQKRLPAEPQQAGAEYSGLSW
ncbi:hypothetical protein PCASD_04337 [Puccinia coronata f. sp. avenae]|uniref:Uncharacterized protein n=1 Tax=Puccinia coronata f. sp. avenae TaxID=200324 RepID=A0A2N5VCS2_9BASI|nr:hypothetical protein PCASD_04337 [Puccinia coronata f. sp. avenae]